MFEIGDGVNLLSNWSVLNYEISHVHQFYWTNPDTGEVRINWTTVKNELVSCGNGYFNSSDEDTLNRMNIGNYLCLKNKTYPISGNFLSQSFLFLQFSFFKCRNDSNYNECIDSGSIDSILERARMSIRPTSSFVDFNNFTNPI